MKLYNKVFENNKQWVAKTKAINKDFFKHLSEGQAPEILYIGCSDSRVAAEEMTGLGPGQMFVHRNVANLVPNNDDSSASVIEYAVGHLGVKHIVICGHYYCGGVKAAMQAQDLGVLNPWLRNIRDVFRLHKTELQAIKNEEDRYKRLIELNVQEQCINIAKTPAFQKQRQLTTNLPLIHGWVFDIASGELIDLNIDIDAVLSDIQEIYDLGKS